MDCEAIRRPGQTEGTIGVQDQKRVCAKVKRMRELEKMLGWRMINSKLRGVEAAAAGTGITSL